MNRLREAIQKQANTGIGTKPLMFGDVRFADQLFVQDDAIDAILDAVIEALPEEKQRDFQLDITNEENRCRFYRLGGYDFALNDIKQLLLDAKGDN